MASGVKVPWVRARKVRAGALGLNLGLRGLGFRGLGFRGLGFRGMPNLT